jgi:hypothetical protein
MFPSQMCDTIGCPRLHVPSSLHLFSILAPRQHCARLQITRLDFPDLVMSPACERGCRFPFISTQYTLFTNIASTSINFQNSVPNTMQDPRFCSACGAGPFTNVKNHLNKCKESKRRELEFASSICGVKRHGPALDNEI